VGIGSSLKSFARKADGKVRSVTSRPFSSESLKTVAPLIAGVPVPIGGSADAAGINQADRKAGGFKAFGEDALSYTGPRTIRSAVYPNNRELHQHGENAVTLGVVAGVAITCIYASAFCSTALTLGAGYLAGSNWLSNVMTVLGNRPGIGAAGEASELEENIPGDSGPGGENPFSLDPSTEVGKRNLAILAALGGAVALYFIIRHVRK